jgi:hypothetical protein
VKSKGKNQKSKMTRAGAILLPFAFSLLPFDFYENLAVGIIARRLSGLEHPLATPDGR